MKIAPSSSLSFLRGLEIDGRVAGNGELADGELRPLADLDLQVEAILAGVHLGIADLDLQIAIVGVPLLDALQVANEDRLRVGSRLREPTGEGRPDWHPGRRLEVLGQLAVAEGFVALEDDLLEVELLLLVHVEVDRDAALAEGFDLEAHVGEVEALGTVEGLDASGVLVQQRIVEGRAGGQGQGVSDLVSLDLVVARDGDLADDRVLLDREGHDDPVWSLVGVHLDVGEEAEAEDLLDVRRDLTGVNRRTHLGAYACEDGVGLDSLVAAHAQLGNDLATLLHDPIAEEELRAHDVEAQHDPLGGEVGVERHRRHVGVGEEPRPGGLGLLGVVEIARQQVQPGG